MKTRQLDVTQHPCGHSASMRTSLGQTVAPSLLLGPSTAQWKMKVNVSGTLSRGSRGQGSVGQGRTSPYWPDLLLLILSLKSEAVPPRRVSRHSSLIGRGFGLDKVSEMTSTMHFITQKETKIQIKELGFCLLFLLVTKAKVQQMMAQIFLLFWSSQN